MANVQSFGIMDKSTLFKVGDKITCIIYNIDINTRKEAECEHFTEKIYNAILKLTEQGFNVCMCMVQ